MLKKIMITVLSTAVLSAFASGCHKNVNEGLGSAKNPIKLGFMPAPNKDTSSADANVISKELEKFSGFVVKPTVSSDIMSLIDGLKTGTYDAAFISSLGYLLARDWAKATAPLQVKGIDGNMVYRAAIITNSESGITSLAGLNGKNIAFTDPFSTSGYLMPFALFTEKGVKPGNTSFVGSFNDVVEGVYNNKFDAGAIYYAEPDPYGRINDARARLVPKYSDILSKVVIIALTDSVPTMPIAYRKDLPKDVADKLTDALKKTADSQAGIDALKDLYGATGLVAANDESFGAVEETIKKLGKDVKEVVPGGVTFYQKHVWEVVPER